jgi:hypothetical protein
MSHCNLHRNSRTYRIEHSRTRELLHMLQRLRDAATKVARYVQLPVFAYAKFFHSIGETFPQPLHVFRVRDQLSRRTDTNAAKGKKTAAN